MCISRNIRSKFGGGVFAAFALILLQTAFSHAQISDENNSPTPLKLQIRVKQKQLCVGKKVEVIARLTNVGAENVIIDNRLVWRYVTLKSLDQSSIEPTSEFSKLLRVPRFSVITGDNFPDEKLPKEVLKTLTPNGFYEDSFIIRPGDEFFQTAGRYTIKSGYGRFADWSKEGVDLFKGSVYSNKLEITLCKC